MVDRRIRENTNHEMGMKTQLLTVILFQFFAAGFATCKENPIERAVIDISSSPDWRTIRVPDRSGDSRVLIKSLMLYVKKSPEELREIISKLEASAEVSPDLEIGGKIYILNRLYCKVPRKSERDGWMFFGGWGGIGIDENTINSLYPLVLKDGEFSLEQFSGYGGPPYRGLEEFDWLLKRFGRRFDPDGSGSEK